MSILKNKKDKLRRINYMKNEKMLNIYKMLSQNKLMSNIEKYYFKNELSKIGEKSSICKIKNRCIFTGRARGIVSEYRISRLQFRELSKLGVITGIRKLSY